MLHIAYCLHSQSWYAPSKHSGVVVDHSFGLRRFVQQSTDMDIEQANVLLCFDVVREIMDQQELPSDREDAKPRNKAELGNVRDFYKWLDKALAPQFEGTATTTNCKYFFENGEPLRAPHPNYHRYDYTLAPPLANEIISMSLEDGDFLQRRFYVIEVAKVVEQHSFFVNPSQNERNSHEGGFTPTEVMTTLMGHMMENGDAPELWALLSRAAIAELYTWTLATLQATKEARLALHLSLTFTLTVQW